MNFRRPVRTVRQKAFDHDARASRVIETSSYPDVDAALPSAPRRRGFVAAERRKAKPGVKATFTSKLHNLLERAEIEYYDNLIAWRPHGRAFVIPDKAIFAREILPKEFEGMSQYATFQRQLNLYGFLRLTRAGPDKEAYYHPLFLRGRSEMSG